MAKDTKVGAAASKVDENGFIEKKSLSALDRGKKLPNFGERRRMFLLSHHPTSFDLCEIEGVGWRLCPTLKRLIVQAGVNFTPPAAKEGGALDAAHIEAKFRSNFGQVVLIEQDEYMYAADGDTGRGYFLKWENVKTYGDGEYEIQMDQAGYDTWRWSLVTGGKVEAPRDSIVAQIRTRLNRGLQRASRTPHLAAAQEATALAKRRLAGLEEALKAIAAATRPNTTRRLPAAPAVEVE